MSKASIRRRTITVASAVVLAGVLTMTATATATANATTSTPGPGPVSLSEIQAKAAAAISRRVDDLNAAVAKAEAAAKLGSGRSALVSYLQQDIGPLQQLGTKIAADTTVSAAEADFHTIFTGYRVLALVLPAAVQAARADGLSFTFVPRLTSDASKAQSHANASNQATVQPMIDALDADISGASTAVSGVANTVLSYTPTQWNADHSVLSPTRSSLSAATGDVKSARNELRQIVGALGGR